MATERTSGFLRHLTRGMAAETLRDESDRQLVERLLTGRDEAAFEAVVRRHGPMVYRVCWRALRREQDTEDAFQATFLILAQQLHTVRKHASLASWLHGIARRVSLKAMAQAATRRRCEQCASTEPFPHDDATWRDLRAVLDAELERLPEKWRSPLILCYLEGRTQDEAAIQLRLSPRTLRRRLEEARAALGRRLTGRGVVWPAALSAVLLSDCVVPAALAPDLIGSTVEALSGSATAVPARVAALTEGVLTTMFPTKLKIAATALLLTAVAVGTGGRLDPTQAAEPQQSPRAAFALMSQAPPADKPVEKGQAGKPTWQIGPTLQPHGDRLWEVAFSADGKWLASSSNDKSVMVFDAAQRKLVHTLSHDGIINAVVFAPDNKTLITASGGGGDTEALIQFWDLGTGKVLATLDGHMGIVHHLSLTGNGKILAAAICSLDRGAKSGEIVFWNVETRKKIAATACDGVYSAILSGDGKKIATAHVGIPQPVKLWDINEKYELSEPRILVENSVVSLLASPDGKTFLINHVFANSPTIDIRDFATEQVVQSFTHEGGTVRSIAFSPDGKTLAAGCCRTIKNGDVMELTGEVAFWDIATRKVTQTLREKLGPVYSVAYSPDGKTLAIGLHHKENIKLKDGDEKGKGGFEQPAQGYAGVVVLCELKIAKP